MAQYYLVKDGQRVGPFELEQLAQQELTPETLAWTEGMANWEPAGTIPALASIFAPKPAPAPQPAPAPAPQPVQQAAPQTQYQQPQYQQPYQMPLTNGYEAKPQLGFMEAVKICLKKYFDFSGRARRSEYWWFMLAIWIINTILNGTLYSIMGGLIAKKAALQAELTNQGLDAILNGGDLSAVTNAAEAQDPTTTIIILGILMSIIFIALFIPQLSATARRLHDVGKSGHLQWLYLLCGIGGPICLILCIPDGKPEPNQYGESPKYVRQQ